MVGEWPESLEEYKRDMLFQDVVLQVYADELRSLVREDLQVYHWFHDGISLASGRRFWMGVVDVGEKDYWGDRVSYCRVTRLFDSSLRVGRCPADVRSGVWYTTAFICDVVVELSDPGALDRLSEYIGSLGLLRGV